MHVLQYTIHICKTYKKHTHTQEAQLHFIHIPSPSIIYAHRYFIFLHYSEYLHLITSQSICDGNIFLFYFFFKKVLGN